ncbi:hypothetical protein [Kibdelosporangium phytohabitans]|uniref:Uncharacterized protein n=1 Tax=Kibdelosporangium phytohabitans TaxID=860235 RepID=A0A0N9HQF0_9PSEU|nr:hypothetical protein [Kibdelosporangium phytohabitans]ALG06924.1 hypothetical protein AOZ06_08275 [Kibdelosporangium phytohabitans]MBE1468186.1 hypothetical protein [Kibdelosporangium phytohabitans]
MSRNNRKNTARRRTHFTGEAYQHALGKMPAAADGQRWLVDAQTRAQQLVESAVLHRLVQGARAQWPGDSRRQLPLLIESVSPSHDSTSLEVPIGSVQAFGTALAGGGHPSADEITIRSIGSNLVHVQTAGAAAGVVKLLCAWNPLRAGVGDDPHVSAVTGGLHFRATAGPSLTVQERAILSGLLRRIALFTDPGALDWLFTWHEWLQQGRVGARPRLPKRLADDLADEEFGLGPAQLRTLGITGPSGSASVAATQPRPGSTRRDAEITISIHNHIKTFCNDDTPDGNPWNVHFSSGLFNTTFDANVFYDEKSLRSEGWTLTGNSFVREDSVMLPLYDAKMTRHFDHRFTTHAGMAQTQINNNPPPRLTLEDHCDPNIVSLPRYWVFKRDVDSKLEGKWTKGWMLGWRDVTRGTDERTMIATVIPKSAVGDKFRLVFAQADHPACLQANLSSLVLDYSARQKHIGVHLNFHVVKQLPVLEPAAYDARTPWQPDQSLGEWISMRVLELSYTAWDMQPYARDLGDDGPPFQWNEERRAQLRAELDAAYLQLYGLDRSDAEHVIDSFFVLRKNEERQYGEFRTRRLVLAAYDAIAEGEFVSPLDPAPGLGLRHPGRDIVAAVHPR